MSDEKNTQPLHVTDDTQVIGQPGDTRRLPEAAGTAGAETRPDARARDPLSVFDEPRRDDARPEGHWSDDAAASASDRSAARSQALVSTGPRTGTIVWGFLVVAVGVGLLAQAAGARIDVELAAILLLGVAGVLLVVGSLVSAVRRRRDETRA